MKATVSIDWCSFTVRCEPIEEQEERHSSTYDDVLYIIEGVLRLKPEQFSPMEHGGRHGYRKGVSFNGIEIYYDGNSLTMGANVSMSGDGCRTFTQFHPMEELLQIIHEGVKEGEINPTRLDVACDDHTGLLNLRRIIEVIRERKLRSRITHRRGIFNLNGSDQDEGDTVYIGSEKSEMRIRIYDKAKEQGDYDGTWNRLEMVNRRDYARAVIEALVTSGAEMGEIVAGILADRIAFIELDDVNISRCSLASWWAEFLETLKRIKLMFKEKPEMAVERLAHFFGDDLAACVYVLSEAFGDGFWKHVKDKGKEKIRKRHKTALDAYRAFNS
ncbi:MAG: replication initiation factor domain-containing protein [Oscillospiraceae bacterium]|nr:replication initiation factor domain-containing protein [Oscillospiraceae bacterium]